MFNVQSHGALQCYVNSGGFVARWPVPVVSFRQQRADRSSGLLGPPTPVQSVLSAVAVSSPPIRPHHQRVSLFPLAARVVASRHLKMSVD